MTESLSPTAGAVEIEARVKALKSELRELEERLYQARIAESPTKIGQIYARSTTRGYGRNKRDAILRGQVTRFVNDWGRAAPELRLFKKDGTLGERTTKMYSYEGWRLEAAPQPERSPVETPQPNTDETKD